MKSLDASPAEEGENSSSASYAATQATESTEVQTSLDDSNDTPSADVDRLEKHCSELKHSLESVQGKILKILSEKKACNEENCALKQRVEELSKSLDNEPAPGESSENPGGPLTYTVFRGSAPEESLASPIIGEEAKNNIDFNGSPSEESGVLAIVSEDLKDSPRNAALKCFPFMNRPGRDPNSDSPYRLFPPKASGTGFKFENLSQFAFELSQSLSEPESKEFGELGISPLPAIDSPLTAIDSSFGKIDSPLPAVDSTISKIDSPLPGIDSSLKSTREPVGRRLEWGEGRRDEAVQTSEEIGDTAGLKSEIGELREKCSELEASLELMRVEFEKCEDYWQGKLNEERAIFDQEQRLSDEKFAELEVKIQEYAEMFGPEDVGANTRLPTIDERDCLEKQVTDLEEEFEEFRKSAESEKCLLTEQIERLQSEIKELGYMRKSTISDKADVGIQVVEDSLENRLRDHRATSHSKSTTLSCVPSIEVTAPTDSECRCPCHGAAPRRAGRRQRESRQRLQAECEVLQRRREIALHQLGQMQQRSSLYYPPAGDRRLISDVEIFHSLGARLRHQELRCRHLQSALKHHQRHTDRLLQNAWDQYQADLCAVQKTLHITQDKLMQQSKLCRTQLERLAASDVLVKDLYKENAQLSALVQRLEEQNLFVDASILASSV